jgi:hypothetical protein
MLPVIWTDDSETVDCKSYFNLYTFLVIVWYEYIIDMETLSRPPPTPSPHMQTVSH